MRFFVYTCSWSQIYVILLCLYSWFNNIVYITSMLKPSCRRSSSGLFTGIHYILYHFYRRVRDWSVYRRRFCVKWSSVGYSCTCTCWQTLACIVARDFCWWMFFCLIHVGIWIFPRRIEVCICVRERKYTHTQKIHQQKHIDQSRATQQCTQHNNARKSLPTRTCTRITNRTSLDTKSTSINRPITYASIEMI